VVGLGVVLLRELEFCFFFQVVVLLSQIELVLLKREGVLELEVFFHFCSCVLSFFSAIMSYKDLSEYLLDLKFKLNSL